MALMASQVSKVIALNRARKKPATLSANALREIDKQKEHRNRVLQAQKVTDTLISRKTVEKWKRLREKNKMKTENPKYDGMALSLKLHTNVINLDAFLRNNERHRSLLKNVQAFTNNRESDRTKNYRKLRMRMRNERLKEQEYHMQELASTLRKPVALTGTGGKAGGVEKKRFSSTAPESKIRKSGRSHRPGSSNNRSPTPTNAARRSSTLRSRTSSNDSHSSDFPLSDSLKMKRPGSTASSRSASTPSAKRGRRREADWSDGGSHVSRVGEQEDLQLTNNAHTLHGDKEGDNGKYEVNSTSQHINHIVTSEANLMNMGYLDDEEFLRGTYTKYQEMGVKEMKKAIYDKIMAEIPPLVTKQDIDEEQKREGDPEARPFGREEEEEKNLMSLQHLERMLLKFKNAGVDVDKVIEDERRKNFELTHGGHIDTDKTNLDSPRLRRLRPHLSEGGGYYSESMLFPEQEENNETTKVAMMADQYSSFIEKLSFKEKGEKELVFEGAEPMEEPPMEQWEEEEEEKEEDEEDKGNREEEEREEKSIEWAGRDGARTTGFFQEDGFIAEDRSLTPTGGGEESEVDPLEEKSEEVMSTEATSEAKALEPEPEAELAAKPAIELEVKDTTAIEAVKDAPLIEMKPDLAVNAVEAKPTIEPATKPLVELEAKNATTIEVTPIPAIELVPKPTDEAKPKVTIASAPDPSVETKPTPTFIPKMKKEAAPVNNSLLEGILVAEADGGTDIFGGIAIM
jgi:hypothetical protein